MVAKFPPIKFPPKFPPKLPPKLLQFIKADRNHDGKLSLAEYVRAFSTGKCGTPAVMAFRKLDRNHDGFLSYDEFAGNIRKPFSLKDLVGRLK